MEAEGAFFTQAVRGTGIDGEEVGELAAEQLFRIAFEVVCELLRHVREGAEVVGLPEPAPAAVFELVDELKRLSRLRLQAKSSPGIRQNRPRSRDAVGNANDREEGDSCKNLRAIGNR